MIERTGQMLSHYRLVEKIGEGGMGIVYKALDTKLQRNVAIKILPPDLTADEERRARFQREAQTAAALNHPNIATIHEIDEHDGALFIAMELVEGKSLRALVDSGSMDSDRALRIGTQIAEGIARAHQAGIVHRDLKPENVIVGPEDHVKILDFGLAKLRAGADTGVFPARDPSGMETISVGVTRDGKILGTAAYMSPEQARGETVDHRSDIFSFGTNLFEMVTGKTPFAGNTPMDMLTSIIRDEPPQATALNPRVSGEMQRILVKCLEKEPERRYQSTADLVSDLRQLRRQTDSQPMVPAEAASGSWRAASFIMALGLGLTAIGAVFFVASAGLGLFKKEGPAPLPDLRPRRITANPAENWVTDGDISPDGKFLAFADQIGIHVQNVDSGESRDLPLPEGTAVYSLGWFPDGSKLITSETSKSGDTALWSISILSGDRRLLHQNARQAAVSPDGTRIAFLGGPNAWSTREIWMMGAGGEEPRKVIAAQPLELFSQPAWSPDSERIAYVKYSVAGAGLEAAVQSVDALDGLPPVTASQWKLTVEEAPPAGEASICWLSDNRIIMARGEDLYEVPVNPRTGGATGEPRRMTTWTGFEPHELSISKDGKRLAFQNVQLQVDVFVGVLENGGRKLASPKRITLDDRRDYNPSWTADGQSILFHSDRRGTWDIYRQEIASMNAQALVTGPEHELSPRLAPDKKSILYWEMSAGQESSEPARLMLAPLEGGVAREVLQASPESGLPQFRCPSTEAKPCLLGETIQGQLVLTAFTPADGRLQQALSIPLTGAGQSSTVWDLSPDGLRVALLEQAGRMRLLEIATESGREFRVDGASGFDWVSWAPDGKSLFVIGRDPGAVILHVDASGKSTPIWKTARTTFVSLAPSPDGRYLAVTTNSLDSDIWLLEGL